MQASQRSVAIIAEMIHTASLVHDDVIDDANSRRGKMTVNQIWGERKVSVLSRARLAFEFWKSRNTWGGGGCHVTLLGHSFTMLRHSLGIFQKKCEAVPVDCR